MSWVTNHYIEHAPRGFGEDPANCPVCPHNHADLEKRIAELEGKKPADSGVWGKVAIGAVTSILAAYVIERFVRRK